MQVSAEAGPTLYGIREHLTSSQAPVLPVCTGRLMSRETDEDSCAHVLNLELTENVVNRRQYRKQDQRQHATKHQRERRFKKLERAID